MKKSKIADELVLRLLKRIDGDGMKDDLEVILLEDRRSDTYVKELQQRNKVLIEALRKVKLLVEKLMVQNKELKSRLEKLEEAFKAKGGKGIKIVSAIRYNEMKKNADELARSLPKLIKLIKLLNQENRLLKEKYKALENEFEDLINERDDLKERIRILNERNQQQVIYELTELFPSTQEAVEVAKAIDETTQTPAVQTPARQEVVTAPVSSAPRSFEEQARADLQNIERFDNSQIAKLVELVVKINEKLENLNKTMVVMPARSRKKAQIDLSDVIKEGELEKPEEPPERPDLEEVLDDILISG
ncbi:MAG: hypothetical protein ACTSYD_14195 [Candidatus Heimdallarchaeaceae archaeon]